MSRSLNLEYLRKQAKAILKQCREASPAAIDRMRSQLPRLATLADEQIPGQIQLADVHQALACENGYANWGELKRYDAPLVRFLTAVRGGAWREAQHELQQSAAIVEESIHAACALGHAEAVLQHLDSDPKLLTVEADGWLPLVYACASPFHQLSERHAAGIAECVALLLDRGADPNTDSAVRRALLVGNRSAALVLYQRGANHSAVRNAKQASFKQAFWGIPEESTLVDKALADLFQDTELVGQMNRRMAEAVARHGAWLPKAGSTQQLSPKDVYAPVHPWNQGYNVMIWELLIKRGVRPNWNDTTNDSPLHHLAMRNGDAATAEIFLSNGANPNLRQADGKTPYLLAVRSGNTAIADVLREYGASLESVRPADDLIGACRRVDAKTASSIVRTHPETLQTLNTEDYETLIQSAGQNRLDAVRLMLEVGINPSAFGESRSTALHAAAWHGHVQMVRLLLGFGARVDIRDGMFEATPLEWAAHGSKHARDAAGHHEAIMKMLQVDAGPEGR